MNLKNIVHIEHPFLSSFNFLRHSTQIKLPQQRISFAFSKLGINPHLIHL